MEKLLAMSATQIAAAIRDGELSPVEAVQTHIRRIEEVNPVINAVVNENFEKALAEATVAEEELAHMKGHEDELPPFFGVPCTVKETFAMTDMPWTGGSYFRKNVIAGQDATAVKRYKDAGAIIIGRTNVPEAAMWIESYNTIYGRTLNPYDQTRGVGGSSGGEGAIIGAGGSPMGVGSDIGGSIRYPSFFNGICGHKPTGGIVPQTGHWPPSGEGRSKYMCCGPMTRRVEDLMPLLKILAGPDGQDGSVEERPLGDPDKVNLDGMRVYYYNDIRIAKADHEVKRAIAMAAAALEDRGCIVEEWRPPGIERGVDMWSACLSVKEGPDFHELVFGSAGGEGLPSEILKAFIGKSKVTAPALGMLLLEKFGKLVPGQLEAAAALVGKLQRRIEKKLGDDGILLSPPFACPAPKHGEPWLKLNSLGFCSVFNVLEFPGTIVPVRWTSGGLPVGVLLTGKRMDDHKTIAAAKAIEEEFGGWKMAPVV